MVSFQSFQSVSIYINDTWHWARNTFYFQFGKQSKIINQITHILMLTYLFFKHPVKNFSFPIKNLCIFYTWVVINLLKALCVLYAHAKIFKSNFFIFKSLFSEDLIRYTFFLPFLEFAHLLIFLLILSHIINFTPELPNGKNFPSWWR